MYKWTTLVKACIQKFCFFIAWCAEAESCRNTQSFFLRVEKFNESFDYFFAKMNISSCGTVQKWVDDVFETVGIYLIFLLNVLSKHQPFLFAKKMFIYLRRTRAANTCWRMTSHWVKNCWTVIWLGRTTYCYCIAPLLNNPILWWVIVFIIIWCNINVCSREVHQLHQNTLQLMIIWCRCKLLAGR